MSMTQASLAYRHNQRRFKMTIDKEKSCFLPERVCWRIFTVRTQHITSKTFVGVVLKVAYVALFKPVVKTWLKGIQEYRPNP